MEKLRPRGRSKSVQPFCGSARTRAQGSGHLSSVPLSCAVGVVRVCGGGPSPGMEGEPEGCHTFDLVHRGSASGYQETKFGFSQS